MVTVGFIAEGDSEVILLKSEVFQSYLNSLNLESSGELVINAKGKYNLYHPNGDFTKLKDRVDAWLEILYTKGVQVVFVLIDRDNDDTCYIEFKSKIYHHPENIIIVARQELEAWYLADTNALQTFLGVDLDEIEFPELFLPPIEEIKRLRQICQNKGVADKKILTNHMLRCGFSLANAAAHPTCPSAAYFQQKLIETAQKR